MNKKRNWEKIFEEQTNSGLSAKEYCNEEDINYSLFCRQRSKFTKKGKAVNHKASKAKKELKKKLKSKQLTKNDKIVNFLGKANDDEKELFTDQDILCALVETNFNLSDAAKILDCSYFTLYNKLRKNENLRDQYDILQDAMLDQAEIVIHDLLYSPHDKVRFNAAKLMLKTKGKKRGWTEKIEHEHIGDKNKPIIILDAVPFEEDFDPDEPPDDFLDPDTKPESDNKDLQ